MMTMKGLVETENQDGDSGLPLSPFTGEEYFTHTTQDKDHDSQLSQDFLLYMSSW